MPEDYWDPAALLRIRRGCEGGFACVALASAGGRCESVHSERRPKILRLLNQLSRSRPESSQSAVLTRLADLSLCDQHQEDAPEVVADWEAIIDLANQHHQNLLRFDLAEKQAEIEQLRSKLNWVNRFLTWKNKDLAAQLARQGWLAQMEGTKGIKEINNLRRSNTSLQARRTQFLSEQDRLEYENDTLRTELNHAELDLVEYKEDVSRVEAENDSLRQEVQELKEKLQEEMSNNARLQKRAASLEELVQELRDDLSNRLVQGFMHWDIMN
ncbi:hypothetical protein ACJ41O_009135 [Fusarium nematophilum]